MSFESVIWSKVMKHQTVTTQIRVVVVVVVVARNINSWQVGKLPAWLAGWLVNIFGFFAIFRRRLSIFVCQLAIGIVCVCVCEWVGFFFGVGNIYRCFVFFLPLRRATMYTNISMGHICDLMCANSKTMPQHQQQKLHQYQPRAAAIWMSAESGWNCFFFISFIRLYVCVCHFPLFFPPFSFLSFRFLRFVLS